MTIKARMARGSRIGIKGAKETSYIYIGNVKTVGIPEASTDEIDVSTLDSEGESKEFLMGATDPGQLTIEGNYSAQDAGQQKLYGYSTSKEVFEFVIEVAKKGETSCATLKGTALVQSCKRFGDIAEGELIPFNATLKLTGATHFTAATAQAGS
jgi:hypothetical protein